jgi:hypothetical protein
LEDTSYPPIPNSPYSFRTTAVDLSQQRKRRSSELSTGVDMGTYVREGVTARHEMVAESRNVTLFVDM